MFLYPRCMCPATDGSHTENNFDDWLKYLFVLSCLNLEAMQDTIEYDHVFDFQLITIHTILELFYINNKLVLTDSPTSDLTKLPFIKADIENRFKLLNTDTMKLIVTNVFTTAQIDLIFNESYIGELIGRTLWSYLGEFCLFYARSKS